MGFALSGAAGAGGDAFQELLKQKFLEQISQQKLMEETRQADMVNAQATRRNDIDLKQVEATERLRQATQEGLNDDRKKRDEDRDASRELQAEQKFQGRIRMMPKGARITGEQAVDFAKYGASPMLKPATNAAGEPEFEYGGTQDANAQADRAAETERYHKVLEGLSNQRIDIAEAMRQLAETRTSWGPPAIQIHTTDADGNAVTKVTSKTDAVGKDFDAAPTTDERNRKAAGGRVQPLLDSVVELSDRINVNEGVYASARGAAAQQAAKVNLDDDVAEYEAMVQSFTPLWARAMGHTGVLTELDVQSARKILPGPKDSKTLKNRKIARINKVLGGEAPAAAPAAAPGGKGATSIKSITEIK